MSTEANLLFLLYFAAFTGSAATSDVQSSLAEVETTVSILQRELKALETEVRQKKDDVYIAISKSAFKLLNDELHDVKVQYREFQDYRLKIDTDVSKMKTEFQEEYRLKMDTFFSEVKNEFQDYRLTLNTDISKVKNQFLHYRIKMDTGISMVSSKYQTEIKKMSSEIKEMKSTIESTINEQQKTMVNKAICNSGRNVVEVSILTLQIDKLIKSANEVCFLHADNAASCIRKPFCAFCAKNDFTSSRCDSPRNLNSNGCPQSSIIYSNESPEMTVGPSDPQSAYTMPMCPETKRNVTLSIHTSNYPLDIYILLDAHMASWSSQHSSQYITSLAEIAKNFSLDYTLGLGISTDKPKRPLGSHKTFSFKNAVRLTNEAKQLTDYLRSNAGVNSEGDTLDSQLEGIFQAMACKEQIGWRNNSRKILLSVFGYRYHVNGDGAKAGIKKPFDGLCALNATGFYDNELTQDYPSEDQISQIIRNENINAVFALHTAVYGSYERLIHQMEPTAYRFNAGSGFASLTAGFTEVMKKMNSRIELEQSKTSDDVRVTLYSSCNGEEEQKTSNCKNIVNGTSKFRVEFEMLRCPTLDSNRNQLIKITPKGLPISAQIQMRLFCNCTF